MNVDPTFKPIWNIYVIKIYAWGHELTDNWSIWVTETTLLVPTFVCTLGRLRGVLGAMPEPSGYWCPTSPPKTWSETHNTDHCTLQYTLYIESAIHCKTGLHFCLIWQLCCTAKQLSCIAHFCTTQHWIIIIICLQLIASFIITQGKVLQL